MMKKNVRTNHALCNATEDNNLCDDREGIARL